MDKFIPDRKYIFIRAFLKLISKSLPQISGLRIWFPLRNEFVVFSTIRLKREVDFFIREFLVVFYFPSAFIVVSESF